MKIDGQPIEFFIYKMTGVNDLDEGIKGGKYFFIFFASFSKKRQSMVLEEQKGRVGGSI
jgi:hypothetical protein